MDTEISVGSATEWDRLIAEGVIDQKLGFIVSDEQASEFHVSLFTLPRDDDDYAYCRNQPARTVRLDDLINALQAARNRLRALKG